MVLHLGAFFPTFCELLFLEQAVKINYAFKIRKEHTNVSKKEFTHLI